MLSRLNSLIDRLDASPATGIIGMSLVCIAACIGFIVSIGG